MSNQQAIFNLIKAVSGQANILTIPRVFIDVSGDITTALFLSQCVYWSDKTSNPEGWFYKTYADWEQELGLSYFQIKRAATSLKGIVETKIKRANAAPTIHYRVNVEALSNAILEKLEYRETRISNNSNNDIEETSKSDIEETQESLTETTHNPPSETTLICADAPPPPEKIKKPKKQPDPRLENPALVAYREETRLCLPVSWRDEVIYQVTDPVLWKSIVHQWIGRGWNKQNVQGMLDAYSKGGISTNGSNGKQSKSDLARAAFGLGGSNGNRQ